MIRKNREKYVVCECKTDETEDKLKLTFARRLRDPHRHTKVAQTGATDPLPSLRSPPLLGLCLRPESTGRSIQRGGIADENSVHEGAAAAAATITVEIACCAARHAHAAADTADAAAAGGGASGRDAGVHEDVLQAHVSMAHACTQSRWQIIVAKIYGRT